VGRFAPGQPVSLTGGTSQTRAIAAQILEEAGVAPILNVGGPVMQAGWTLDPPEDETGAP